VALRDYTQDLLRHLGEASGVQARGIGLHADIADVQGTLDVSVPYGLLVTELVSNCLKHGFPAGQRGNVWIQLAREGSAMTLSVTDDGVGLPASFDIEQVQSMGLQLATSLAAQLGGELRAQNCARASDRAGGAKLSATLARLSPAPEPAP
jgi:two-component sensor histidine kinase